MAHSIKYYIILKKIIVASTNPVKVSCTKEAFEKVFPDEFFDVVGVDAPSGVTDQPMTEEETLMGAMNRANYARNMHQDALYWVGIEGGIHQEPEIMEAFAWIVILSDNRLGRARTATFQLPPEIVKLVNSGVELGHADDMIFRRTNSKQGNGAVGILTNDLIDRTDYYRHAVVLALIPFIHPKLYSVKDGQN